METFEVLEQVKIPKFCSPNLFKPTSVKLHDFCDELEQIYAAVAFLRFEKMNSCVSIILVAAKTRVAPMKIMSILRLDLQVAIIERVELKLWLNATG